MLTAEEVRAEMLRKIAASGLDAADAKRLGFKAFTKHQLQEKFPRLTKYPAAGFILPYYDALGGVTEFFRFRYLERPSGFIGSTDAVFKYTQPAKMRPYVYFSKFLDWADYFTRPVGDRAIFITEGELKANCGCKMAIPTLGLGGVWNFKEQANCLIRELALIDWKDVAVYITYDSDAVTNYHVLQAENRLAKELLEKGAKVFIVRLPALPDVKKTGLDDYLVKEGIDAFYDVAAGAEPWNESKALHELNESIVFVRDPGLILEISSKQRMSPHSFKESIYANVIWESPKATKEGVVMQKKSAAKGWLEWPHRGEVRKLTYQPGAPRITEANDFNMWPGWGVKDALVQPGGIKPWTDLISHLFARASLEDLQWFLKWLAYPLQHPGTKLFTATVLWGLSHGTGKTLIGATMRKIYGANFVEIQDRDLTGNFNEWAINKQFVMGDEITGGDKRTSGDRMKSLITQQFIRINQKNVQIFELPDCINYYFTSNHPDSFYLEDNDRRYYIHEVTGKPLTEAFYREYDAWYKTPEGIGALFHYFLHMDLKGFNPLAPAPMTAAKREMLDMGRSDASAWIALLKDEPDMALKSSMLSVVPQYSFMTTSEILFAYDPEGKKKLTLPGMGRELRRAGFVKVNNGATVTTVTDGPQRLWIVRRREILEGLGTDTRKIIEIYDAERGKNGTGRKVTI